jgi:thiamine biosynthesis protein ThiS
MGNRLQIVINGQVQTLAGPCSIADVLKERGLDPGRVAIEHNTNVLLREQLATIQLQAGDTLEIVQFVGGG